MNDLTLINRNEIANYIGKKVMTRNVDELTIHCTATKPGHKADVDTIDGWHKARGFIKRARSGRYCGYHFVILSDGTIQIGRFLNETGAHVAGANSRSVGISYVGGLNTAGKAADTRTPEQKQALVWLLALLVKKLKPTKIKGHRDHSPDKNGNGIIEPWEWIKECPCFDASTEYAYFLKPKSTFNNFV